jgi:hypothetical protein
MEEIMLTGSCRCGAVSYKLAMDAEPETFCCHCLDCQKWSGSAFAEQAVIPEDAIRSTGPIVRSLAISRQGGRSIQYVCGECHARIFNTSPERPGIAVLRAGTLDDTSRLEPRVHIWVKRKQPWVTLPEDVMVFERSPSADEIKILLQPSLPMAHLRHEADIRP